MSLNVAIVGPGRSNQGTGPYIARTFCEQGANICGVVSSTKASAEIAAQKLYDDYEIKCKAYETLTGLIKNNEVDIVVISSPVDSHFDHLILAVKNNCHIFCEKPLWWPSISGHEGIDVKQVIDETTSLVTQCRSNNLILQLNTQWPFTLPSYYEIFPQGSNTERVKNFSMWLSPQSSGNNMVIDAVPHLLSMLYSILSTGRIQNIQTEYQKDSPKQNISIHFDYLHATGDTNVSINLKSSDEIPKPAAYAINNNRVDRHVELSNYLISLRTADKYVPIMDPLVCSIKNFISSIYSKASSDETALIDGMHHLVQIYQAVTQDKQ